MGGTYTAVAPETNGWAGTISGVDQDDCYTWKIRVTQDTAGTYIRFQSPGFHSCAVLTAQVFVTKV